MSKATETNDTWGAAQRPPKYFVWFSRTVQGLSFAFLIALTVLVVVEVILRYFLHFGLAWANELILFVFIWLAMLGVAVAIGQSQHFAVEVVAHLSPRLAKLSRLTAVVSAAFFELVLFREGLLVEHSAIGASALLAIPNWAAYLAFPLSGAIGLVYCVFVFLGELKAT